MLLGCLYANVQEDFTVNVSVFTVFSQKTEDEDDPKLLSKQQRTG